MALVYFEAASRWMLEAHGGLHWYLKDALTGYAKACLARKPVLYLEAEFSLYCARIIKDQSAKEP